MRSSSLYAALRSEATAGGFGACAGVDLSSGLPSVAPALARYARWLDEKKHGDMQYLERGRDRRDDPRKVFSAAKSVFFVALPYALRQWAPQEPAFGSSLIDRDYHQVVKERLERVLCRVRESLGLERELQWKICVDTSAFLEKSWAAIAGLGWIGKNSLLIHPRLGSAFHLGAALLSEELGSPPSPLQDGCGTCRCCLESCPTAAIVGGRGDEGRALHADRCISYWTLEQRQQFDRELGARFENQVAGCDRCQSCCPHNSSLPIHVAGPITWEQLLEDCRGRGDVFEGTALARLRREQRVRNFGNALANSSLRLDEARRAKLRSEVAHWLEQEASGSRSAESLLRCLEVLQ